MTIDLAIHSLGSVPALLGVDWWSVLDMDLKVFYGMGLIATLILFLQAGMLMIGGDGDVDIGDVDGDIDAGAGVFSLRTLAAFFAGFGWTGAIVIENGGSITMAVLAGILVGAALMGSVLVIMRFFYALRERGNLDYNNAIGLVGTVYISIPPNQSGPGQVQVTVQGRMRVVASYTRETERISNQTKVNIIELMDPNTFIVEPLDSGSAKESPKLESQEKSTT